MTTEQMIDATIPSTLQPAPLLRLADDLGDPGARVLAAATEALDAMGRSLSELQTAARAVEDPEWRAVKGRTKVGPAADRVVMTPDGLAAPSGSEADLLDAARLRAAEVGTTVDGSLATISEALDSFSAIVDRRLAPDDAPRSAILDGEIRAHARSMPEADRPMFAMSAAREGDAVTVRALLSAPGYLSGLPDETMTLVRQTAEQTLVGEHAKRRDAARAAMDAVRTGMEAWANGWRKNIGQVEALAQPAKKIETLRRDSIKALKGGKS